MKKEDMKKHPVIHLVIFFAVVSFFFVLSTDSFARRAKVKAAGPARQSDESGELCKAYIVMEATTGKVLEEQDMHARRAPASMTKLMVAYIVLDKIAKGELHFTDKVRTSREAMKIGGSQVYLKEGEEFTLEESMKAIMIASANDSSYAVSELVSGSSRDFVDLMNETAKSIGMKDTEFTSVHGLPPEAGQKEDLTSCYDMALLAKAILKYPKIIEWTSTKTAPFRGGAFILNNHNKLLTRMPEVDGLKTGFYRETGYNVTATAKKGDLRFIVVVMGSQTAKARDNLACEKLKHAFGEFTSVSVAKKGQPIDKESFLDDGKFKKIKGVAAADLVIPLLRGKKKEIKQVYNLPRIKGEVKAGQKLGEVVYQLDNEVVGRVDVVSPTAVPKANFFTRMVRKTGLNL
jgi:serine-type D-Ala-D-Ala carboxypeptidase (penicillin-binding protein 5/6)